MAKGKGRSSRLRKKLAKRRADVQILAASLLEAAAQAEAVTHAMHAIQADLRQACAEGSALARMYAHHRRRAGRR